MPSSALHPANPRSAGHRNSLQGLLAKGPLPLPALPRGRGCEPRQAGHTPPHIWAPGPRRHTEAPLRAPRTVADSRAQEASASGHLQARLRRNTPPGKGSSKVTRSPSHAPSTPCPRLQTGCWLLCPASAAPRLQIVAVALSAQVRGRTEAHDRRTPVLPHPELKGLSPGASADTPFRGSGGGPAAPPLMCDTKVTSRALSWA